MSNRIAISVASLCVIFFGSLALYQFFDVPVFKQEFVSLLVASVIVSMVTYIGG